MLALHLTGRLEPYAVGLAQLLPMLHCELREDGYPIAVTNADNLTITLNREAGLLQYAPGVFPRPWADLPAPVPPPMADGGNAAF